MSDTEIEKLKAVTPQQIQSVAKRYFTPENMTVAMLDPQPMDEEQMLKQQRAQQVERAAHAH